MAKRYEWLLGYCQSLNKNSAEEELRGISWLAGLAHTFKYVSWLASNVLMNIISLSFHSTPMWETAIKIPILQRKK